MQRMPPAGNPVAPPLFRDSAFSPALKSRICNKYNTAKGCKFEERCYFAHGQQELGKPVVSSRYAPIAARPSMGGGEPGLWGHLAPHGVRPTTIFHAFATWKISVDASIVGIVVGEDGVNTKRICRLTGAKISIRDHESDLSLKNIELEGTYGQIKQASAMVRDLIDNIAARTRLPARNPAPAT